jgi:hypothetical protein
MSSSVPGQHPGKERHVPKIRALGSRSAVQAASSKPGAKKLLLEVNIILYDTIETRSKENPWK